jgi:hypothetical protein
MTDLNRHGGMSKRTNKFTYLHVIQGNYGYGWEDVDQSESYRETRANLKEYHASGTGAHRMIQRRELNEPGPTLYNVVRFHQTKSTRTIKRKVSLEEAQAHCQDPKTSGTNWFDGYQECA